VPKFIVDIWLDGYESEEEMADACEEFIYDQLNFTASSVTVTRVEEGREVNIIELKPREE